MSTASLYQETAVLTQNSEKLIVMLYDGAIKFMKLAIINIEKKDFEAKGKFINKAWEIINELNTVLDMEAGGEIAVNLRALYTFMMNHLMQANLKCDISMVQEVIACMEELNTGWKEITE
jgi:flagellar protein FliS